MSDLCLYDLEDIVWDGFCQTQSDDHIVPHYGSRRVADNFVLGDSHKKPCRELTNISNCAGGRSSAGYVDKGREQGGFSSSSKRSYTMMEKDSWSSEPNCLFPSSPGSNSTKEASCIASENTTPPSLVFKSIKADSNRNAICTNDTILGDKTTAVDNNYFTDAFGNITETGNNLDFIKNTEDKDSSELSYYSWPEIENFEDVDRMFRSCDSTFGLGTSNEDELGWFSSADNIGGSEDIVRSESEFPCPGPNPVEHILQNQDSSRSNFINDFAMTKDSSLTSEEPDSYMSVVDGPAMANSKDRFIPKEQVNENSYQVKLPNQSIGKGKEHYFGNGFNYARNLPSEAMQLPLSYMHSMHSNNSSSSDLTSVNLTPSAVKSETYGLQNDTQFPAVTAKGEKLHSRQGKQVQYSGDKCENHIDAERVSLVIPAELGTSHIQSSTLSSSMDAISQEAATFRQLQRVVEQLDLRTKICIRDSLYRLARSAEQRHNHAHLNGSERDASGASLTAGTNNIMDMEAETNPMDRSIAHLLFHRPSESASMVRGSVTGPASNG